MCPKIFNIFFPCIFDAKAKWNVYQYFKNKGPFKKHNYFANRIEYRVFSDALKLNCQVAWGDAKADAHCL